MIVGLTLEQYWELYNKQNKVCAICQQPDNTKIQNRLPLLVDHSHKTQKYRALLCSQCNILIGMADENIDILKATITYLEAYNEKV